MILFINVFIYVVIELEYILITYFYNIYLFYIYKLTSTAVSISTSLLPVETTIILDLNLYSVIFIWTKICASFISAPVIDHIDFTLTVYLHTISCHLKTREIKCIYLGHYCMVIEYFSLHNIMRCVCSQGKNIWSLWCFTVLLRLFCLYSKYVCLYSSLPECQ